MKSSFFSFAVSLAAAAVVSCSSSEEPTLCSSGKCASRVSVAQKIAFVTELREGVSDGFDLDGANTTAVDLTGCGRIDYQSPDGKLGIDNQLAHLWPALQEATGDAVPGLLKGAIADGTLLLMVRLDGVDDPKNDDCVDATILLGDGKPDIGTDGLITSGQTFDIHETSPRTGGRCGKIVNGVYSVGPFEADVPVRILDVSVVLKVHAARIRAVLKEDGAVAVTIGGGVELAQVAELAGREQSVAGLIGGIVQQMADLAPNEAGICSQLSVAMQLDAVPAFLFDPATK